MIKKYIYSSFQKRLKFYKIIFIFIVFVSCTAFLLLYINKLKIQINLKTLENKEIERNRLILIDKIQINKMS